MPTDMEEVLKELESAQEFLLPVFPEPDQISDAEQHIVKAINLIKEHLNANSSTN